MARPNAPIADAPLVTVHDRAELRAWLQAHHDQSGTVWLATCKRHHAVYLVAEAVTEELLCWGWIDSLPRSLGPDLTDHLIAPRIAASAWSAVNKALEVPPDLAVLLTGPAAEVWAAYPRTVKRGTLEWLKMAKGAETRAAPVADIATIAAAGQRPKPFRR